jgi:LysR family glycine cleavage system transcriptional activator
MAMAIGPGLMSSGFALSSFFRFAPLSFPPGAIASEKRRTCLTWTRWFDAAGVADPVIRGPVLNRASMLIDAAVDGQGIALARSALAAWDLINGRLVRPIDVSLRMAKMYWIVCPKATSALPKIAIFREWLLAQAADDMRRLKTLSS